MSTIATSNRKYINGTQTESHAYKGTDGQTYIQVDRQKTDGQTYREPNRQTERKTDKLTDH